MKHCPHCKSNQLDTANFCGECGFEFGDLVNKRQALNANLNGLNVTNDIKPAISQTLFVLPSFLVSELQQLFDQYSISPLRLVADSNPEVLKQRSKQSLRESQSTRKLRFVCLIGGWELVSPYQLSNPAREDGDDYCYSDAPYGCIDDVDEENIRTLLPDIPVGRIPSTDIETIRRVLFDSPIAKRAVDAFYFAVTADCWVTATKKIVDQFNGEARQVSILKSTGDDINTNFPVIFSSPEWDEDTLSETLSGSNPPKGAVILFNVHGSPDEPQWVGEGGDGERNFVPIFHPETVQDFNDAILVTEACYGGALNFDGESIAESFFKRGGKAFVGCSVIAYSTHDGNLAAADLIALHFLNSLDEGKTLGESLNIAKERLCDTDPEFDDLSRKTVMSFNLYGAPWHSCKLGSSSWVSMAGATVPSVLNTVTDESESALDRARRLYRSRISRTVNRLAMSREDAMEALKSFREAEKIEKLVQCFGASIETCQVDVIQFKGEQSYRVSGRSGKVGSHAGRFIVAVNANGTIKNTLVSRGLV